MRLRILILDDDKIRHDASNKMLENVKVVVVRDSGLYIARCDKSTNCWKWTDKAEEAHPYYVSSIAFNDASLSAAKVCMLFPSGKLIAVSREDFEEH